MADAGTVIIVADVRTYLVQRYGKNMYSPTLSRNFGSRAVRFRSF